MTTRAARCPYCENLTSMTRLFTPALTLLLLASALHVNAATAPAAAPAKRPAAWCEEQWAAASPDYLQRNDFDGLLARWQQLAGECRGTVAYEARLALAHTSLGDFNSARTTLESIDGLTSEYSWLAELMYLLNDSREHLATDRFDDDYLERLADRWEEYVRSHPNRPEGYRELGNVRMLQGRYEVAVANLEKAVASERQAWLIFRDLAIGYSMLGRYDETMLAGQEAIKQRRGLSTDPEFVYAIARANAGLGRIELARQAMDLIVRLKPEVKDEPDYKETVNFIRAQEKAGKRKP